MVIELYLPPIFDFQHQVAYVANNLPDVYLWFDELCFALTQPGPVDNRGDVWSNYVYL